MRQNVRVAVSEQSFFKGDFHAAEHEFPIFDELVRIYAYARAVRGSFKIGKSCDFYVLHVAVHGFRIVVQSKVNRRVVGK